ncbi:MAG: DUF4249 domain-containing protein [Flavobacteriaceae bacterium]|nr:DUF4249 domain-containing protein [Flavobacteriaceae bacterium]
MKKKWNYRILALMLFMIPVSCTEEISFETADLESALVIEAIITDEDKQHEILLSRTYEFEADGPTPETGATVTVESSAGTIVFEETENGRYVSESSFAAVPNVDYQLKIRTSDGKAYNSNNTQLTKQTDIGALYAERVVDDIGNDGVSIFVDSFDPEGESQFYRFTYVETFKVIAPLWRLEDLIVIDPTWPECSVELVNKEEEKRVCFRTESSTEIVLGNTTSLNEDRLERFQVRRINRDDYRITHRYSVLVRQFVQSREAYTYYETLQEFSGQGSIFSQSQPGFFDGNIVSESNSEEKVVGFFEVSHVATQRVFFNFRDLIPEGPLPPYVSACTEFAPPRDLGHPTDACGSLIFGLLNGEIVYTRDNPVPETTEVGPYFVAQTVCGDCTQLGTNVIPEFWEK